MPKRKKSSPKHTPQARPVALVSLTPRMRVFAGVTLIVAVVIIAYYPALRGEFIWDDHDLLTENNIIKGSNGLYRLWFTIESQDYWPMTYTTFWIEWRLWGINPIGYHITNLVLHTAASLLIWVILRKLSIPGAFLAGLIFAVHPVNVESVAWIAQRKNLMAMLFFLLSILWYLKAEMSAAGGPLLNRFYPSMADRWYWLSLLAFLLGMLSKGSVAVLPVLLLGIVWWRRPLRKWDLVRTAPFFLIAVVLTAVNVWFQTHGTEIVIRSAGFTQRLLGAGAVVWFYLYKALLPLDLAFVYAQWQIQADRLLWWLPLLAAGTVTVVLWLYRKSWSRPFLFAWGFFCVALAPAMGFIDVGFMKYSLVADHYQHIALVGVIALVAAGWCVWHERARGTSYWVATVVGIAAVGTLTFLTWRQSGLYSDEITLYHATLEKNPACWVAHNNLAAALNALGQYSSAIEHFQQALRIKSDYAEAHVNLGILLDMTGQPQEAIKHFEQALQSDPENAEFHNNLGITLAKAGQAQKAIEHYEQALRYKPDYAKAHNNLGLALSVEGPIEEAIKHFEQALRFKPDSAEIHNNLGIALAKAGQSQKAIEHYEQALRLKPDFADAHNNLGLVLQKTGQLQEAIKHYKQALNLKPDFAEAYANLALIYAQTNQPADAIGMAEKALSVARSKRQTAMAEQIEEWLNSYRASLSELPSATPPAK